MTIRNPFKKKPEKKTAAPVRPTSPLRTYGDPVLAVVDPPSYTPPPVKPDDCGPAVHHGTRTDHGSTHWSGGGSHGGSHSHDSGSHSSHSSFDSGSHSAGSHDSGSSGCDF